MPRTAAKIDANQNEIVAALRKCGASVAITSSLGRGFPDIICGVAGKNVMLEIKDFKQPPSKRQLTPDERKFSDSWRGQYAIVHSVEEALFVCGFIDSITIAL